MERRTFVIGIGALAGGSSAVVGTGAFSRVEAKRDARVQVVDDGDALLGLEPVPDSPNGDYVVKTGTKDKEVGIDLSPSNDAIDGSGVNSRATTLILDLLRVTNQGTQQVCVTITGLEAENGEQYVYFVDENGDRIDDVELELDVGQHRDLGLEIDTFAWAADYDECDFSDCELVDDGLVEIVAEAGACEPDPGEPGCVDPDVTTWTATGEVGEAGGPIALSELDPEFSTSDTSHGPMEEHANMFEVMIDRTSNAGEGILVLGANAGRARDWWDALDEELNGRDSVDAPFTIVTGADDIENELQSLEPEDYAMVGIASSKHQLVGQGLTSDENVAIADNRDEIADFVNAGGGLVGYTQEDLDREWEYVDIFGDFEVATDSWTGVEITDEGEELGLSEEEFDSWCCWHGVFLDYPEETFDPLFFAGSSSSHEGEVTALGGAQVQLPREVELDVTGPTNVEVGDTRSYDLVVENQGEESIEGEFEFAVIGDATVSDSLPDQVHLDSGENVTFDDGISVTVDDAGDITVDVRLVSAEDGTELVEVPLDLEGIPQDPGVC